MTQDELATLAGISVRALRNIECGHVATPHPRSIGQLATALHLSDAECMEFAAGGPTRTDTPPLSVAILGPLEVRRHGALVRIESPRQAGLLGLLALRPGEVVSSDEIARSLWADRGGDRRDLIYTYVSRLRTALEPDRRRRVPSRLLPRVSGGYRLDLDVDSLDASRFDQLAAEAVKARDGGDLNSAGELYRRALRCWRGRVLADCGDQWQAHSAVSTLNRKRLVATLAYGDVALALGDHESAVSWLQLLLEGEPLHEGLHARLMLALAGTGEQATALQLFAEIRRRLADELGVEPATEIQSAYVRILRGQAPAPQPSPEREDHAVSGIEAGASGRGDAQFEPRRPAQLPPDVTAFVGRDGDLMRLDELRTTGRVVLCGTAGVGKTALAVRWAYRVRSLFHDGQLYLDLRGHAMAAPVRPIEALARFLSALGLPAEKVPNDVELAAELYRTMIADRHMLIILDNAADSHQVRPLLPGGTGNLVLITSRERLAGLLAREGAQHMHLDVMSAADARALLERTLGARRVTDELGAVAALSQACAYLPLALRIAAARIAGNPHGRIADYVAMLGNGDPLKALEVSADGRDAVRAAFDSSYRAQPAPARWLFRCLGLARVPDLTLTAAAALSGTSLDEVTELVDDLASAHLVDYLSRDRFGCHDLLRLYATERAREETDAQQRDEVLNRLHHHYLSYADAAARVLYPQIVRLPPDPSLAGVPVPPLTDTEASAWLDAERHNLVTTITQAGRDGRHAVSWRLADILRGYFNQGMYVVDWLAAAQAALTAARADGDARGEAAARLSLATLEMRRGRQETARRYYTSVLAATRRTRWVEGEASARTNLGSLHLNDGDVRRAAAIYTEVIGALPPGSAPTETARANLGLAYLELGRPREAHDQLSSLVESRRANGHRTAEAQAAVFLGEAMRLLGDLAGAEKLLTRALAVHREITDRWHAVDGSRYLAYVYCDMGRYAEASEVMLAGLRTAGELRDPRYTSDSLCTLATVARRLGRHAEAAAHCHRALRMTGVVGRFTRCQALIELAAARRGLGDLTGASLDARDAGSIARRSGFRLLGALATDEEASALLATGDARTAVRLARRSLSVHAEIGHRLGEAASHRLLSGGLATLGKVASAAEHHDAATVIYLATGAADPGLRLDVSPSARSAT